MKIIISAGPLVCNHERRSNGAAELSNQIALQRSRHRRPTMSSGSRTAGTRRPASLGTRSGSRPDSSTMRRARSTILTGSPMSRTKMSPPSAMPFASMTSWTASGMVMKNRVMSGWVTVTGPPWAIWRRKIGSTEPELPSTFSACSASLCSKTLISARELAATAGPFILLAIALLVATYYWLKPTPPKRVVLATGPEQGAYAAFGARYREELKRHGIEVVLRSSAGSRENLRLLRDPKNDVQLAFVQGGAWDSQRAQEEKKKDEEAERLPLVSLGSMFYEPVWIFYRADSAKKIRARRLLMGRVRPRSIGWLQ